MARPHFLIQSEFADWVQSTVVTLPDYSAIRLENLDIDEWLKTMLGLVGDQLQNTANTLKEGQKQMIKNQIVELNAKLAMMTDTELEDAVVDTSPKVVDEKKRKGEIKEDSEDSAIITTKTPTELKKEKEESMQEYLAKLP